MIIGSAYIYCNIWYDYIIIEIHSNILRTLLLCPHCYFVCCLKKWDLLKLADGTTQPSHPPRLYVATRNNHSVQNHHPILSDVIHSTSVSLFMFNKKTHATIPGCDKRFNHQIWIASVWASLLTTNKISFQTKPPWQVLVFCWKLVISLILASHFRWFGGACHLSTRFFHHLASMHKEIQEQILRTFERFAGKNGEGVQYQPMGQGFF